MPNDNVLAPEARATIMDACQSISRSADALKDCHTVDGDWGDDFDAKAIYDAELNLLGRMTALLARQGQPGAPTFEAKHVSLKQKGKKMILTLELDGVEGAPRYTVTPINPGVVRVQPEPRAEVANWSEPCDGCPTPRACQYDGCRKDARTGASS